MGVAGLVVWVTGFLVLQLAKIRTEIRKKERYLRSGRMGVIRAGELV